jgi:hypothetical protein
MNDGDKQRFAVAMNWLADKFPLPSMEPRTLTKEDLRDYFDALKGLSIQSLERAVKLAFQECRYFPKPVDLRALLKGGGQAVQDTSRQLPAPVASILPPDILEQYHADSRSTIAFLQTEASLEEKLYRLDLMARAYPQFEWQDARDQMEAMCTELQQANAERYERIAAERKNAFSGSA